LFSFVLPIFLIELLYEKNYKLKVTMKIIIMMKNKEINQDNIFWIIFYLTKNAWFPFQELHVREKDD
jgi:hypothetical protein